MNHPLNFKSALLAAAFAMATTAQAQDSTRSNTATMTTDADFNNTTIIFKSVNASDMEILNAYGSSFGMGDVVRITVAPPQPKVAEPVALAPATPAPLSNTPAVSVAPVIRTNAAPINNLPKPPAPAKQAGNTATSTQQPSLNAVPARNIQVVDNRRWSNIDNVKGLDTPAPKKVVAKAVPQAKVEAPAAAPQVSKNTTSVKTGTSKSSNKSSSAKKHKKSKKQGLFQPRYKNKKHGKQRYSCPKF